MKYIAKNPIGQFMVAKFAMLLLLGVISTQVSAGQYGEVKKTAPDIVEVAVSSGDFSTLAAALEAADLVETLKGKGPFTVFAPTNAAFAKLPEGTVEMLLMPENKDKLIAILTYHVVPGTVKAADVVKLDRATSVNGAELAIAVNDSGVFLNQAAVVATDIAASNGVIHVIDQVVLPPSS